MRFDYFDMLSGEPVLLEGVGHIRSPKIKELYPSNGIGYKTYNMYLAFLSMKNEDFTDKFKGLLNHHNENTKYDKLNKYDMMAANKIMRGIYNEILSFFIAETISWDAGSGRFNVYKDTHKTHIGEINSKNFDAVCKTILQFNFIGLNETCNKPATHSSRKSKELWERAQQYLENQNSLPGKANTKETDIGNIISKICAVHPSYNYLNIGELTVFQLYDAFFQISYMRGMNLNEMIFSNHGGKKFKFENWLKPTIKNI